jgi:SAM-dependent methyltransferase
VNLGAGFRSCPAGFLGLDRERFAGIDVVADIRALPFLDASLDGLLCEVVMEHLPAVGPALRELERVLKPGGRVYLTLPFIWPYHASPDDYGRWTAAGVERELGAFEPIRTGLAGGPTTALVNVLHEWLAIVLSFNLEVLYRVVYLALIPVLFPFKLLDGLFSRYRHAHKIAALFYLHGRKRVSTRP